jgi:GNAT superfamily N-acetyltransferase
MMNIQVRRAEYDDIEPLRELYRQEANCQIIYDSILRRKMADPYLILVNGRRAGYAGIWNKFDPGRLMEYYLYPHLRAEALPIFREVLAVTQATQIESQTNMPLMALMLYDCAKNIRREALIFEDHITTNLVCPNSEFRLVHPDDASPNFPQLQENGGDHILIVNGEIVASGGFTTHYNPPYGDVYMGVAETARRQGYGSYIVQEIKRICYEAGRKPAARCNPHNLASRRTLQKAGFLPCGYILVGDVAEAD